MRDRSADIDQRPVAIVAIETIAVDGESTDAHTVVWRIRNAPNDLFTR